MSMFGGGSAPSLADIAAVTKGNNDNDGMGGNGWWVLIILFALFGGWGNNNGRGNGSGDSSGSGTTIVTVPTGGGYSMGSGGYGFGFESAALQRGFDNQTVINKLDGLNSGLCSLGYDQLAQMNTLNNNITQTGYATVQAVNNNSIANMQNTNALQTQISDCCCGLKELLGQVRYDLSTDACAIKNEVHQTGDAIIQNQNMNFINLNQTIRDGFSDIQRQNDQRYIAELERKLNACDRDNALSNQATYLLNNLNPSPRPAYIVGNPNGCGTAIPVVVQSGNSGCNNCNNNGNFVYA